MTDLSASDEDLIKETLRSSHFDFNDEMVDLFLKLKTRSRLEFLKEKVSAYSTDTRAQSLLDWAVAQNNAVLVTVIWANLPPAPENADRLDTALTESVARGHAEIVDILLRSVDVSPGTLGAWLESPIRQNEDTRKIYGSFLRRGFRFETLGPRDFFDTIHNDYINEVNAQAEILFQHGVRYLSADLKCCALRKAAIWHKEKHVRLFLTGGLHKAADAANAIELLQVGSLRHQLMTKYDKSSLTYFREAHRIRKENRIGGGISSLREIEDMEARIAEGDFSKLIEHCFRLIVLNDFDFSVLNDRLNIYEDQSWLFFYFSDLRQLLHFFIGTKIASRRDIQNKFKIKLGDLLLMYQPDWKELIMIFHALRLSPRSSNATNTIFANLDLQIMREVLEEEPTGIVGSLILSYCADIAMPSNHSNRLDEIVFLLLDTEAKLYIRRESHGPMQEELKERAGGDLVFFDSDEEDDECCDYYHSWETGTTYHRIVHSSRSFAGNLRKKKMTEHLARATCCDLDVEIKHRLTQPSKLMCLAARQCPESSVSSLPGPLKRMVLGHIEAAMEEMNDDMMFVV